MELFQQALLFSTQLLPAAALVIILLLQKNQVLKNCFIFVKINS